MALGLPSDPKQQKKLLLGVLPLLAVGAYWYFLHGDFVQANTDMAARLENLEAMNSTARMRSAQSKQLEDKLQEFERQIQRLEQLVPRGEEVAQIVDDVNQRAERVGVAVSRFTPGSTDRGTHYNRRTFDIAVTGTYHDIGRLLAEIGSLPRIVTAIDLALIPTRSVAAEGGPRLEASFLIETYVLPEPTQPVQTAAGGA